MNRAQNEGLPSSARLRALDEAAECFDLSGLEPESGRALATDLQEIVNRIGAVRARIHFVPNLSEANARGLDRYQLFPDESGWMHVLDGYEPVRSAAPNGLLALARDETGEWRFDKDTVEGLAEFRRLVGELEAEIGSATIALTPDRVIRSWMPAPLRNGAVFGLEYWQWLGLAVFIFAGIVLDYSVRFAIRRTWRRIMQQRGREADRPLLKRAVRPFGLFASALLFYWTVRLLGLPPRALVFVLAAVRVFLMLSTVWAAFRVTDLLGEFLASKAAATATKFDDLLVPLVRKTAKVLIFAVGLIYIADTFRIEILPLLTGLGIGGLAFAFAAKDTIENLFGSVAVVVDRPFEVGDWVVIGDVEGTVEELGFRSTRIRTFYNSLVSVPNSTLVRATVDNYGRRRFRRVKMHLGLTYDTPPEKIEAFCEGIRELIRIHPYTRKDYYHVWFNRFGPSSLDVLVYAFHQCADWGTELRERHRLFLDILRLAERLGVQFAFPTQTLHVLQQEADTDH
ncbi:MAG: mechanosensitive ion channel family protein, partial [Planctomycetes bacterium]|nr:mechanosensitive ion channel family protein [Planctomycetota bacterium]